MFPDRAGWTRTNMLLAEAVDTLHWLQWAQTKSGRKNRNRPRPWPRPGITPTPREGSKPKPAPLSVIKKVLSTRHPSSTSRAVAPRSERLKDLFGGK